MHFNKTAIHAVILRMTKDKQRNTKLLRIMRLTAIILLSACITASARSGAQSVTLDEKNVSLDKIFSEIRKQTGFEIIAPFQLIASAPKMTVRVKNASITEALNLCLKNLPLSYEIDGKTIIIKEKQKTPNADGGSEQLPPPIDITGKVTDIDGNPLAGASVKVKGSSMGTTTNNDGVFVLKGVDENATLEISFVGYETYAVAVNNKSTIVASLRVKPENLNEVVINKGYYTEKQKFTVGNVGKVTAKEIEKQPVSNVILALEGRVPGLTVSQTNGLSGGGVTVRIQGQNSLKSGNDPFYVIDGVPYISQLPSTGVDFVLGSSGPVAFGSSPANGNPLSYLNPTDIESIEVLKDADATAIYGSRAANGAILITTKKGKVGATKVNVNAQTGWGRVTRKIDMLNTSQYLEMRKEAFKNDGLPVPIRNINATSNYDLTIYDSTRYTDWQKELIGNTARYSNINADVSGGTSAVQYLIGATYHKETTVFPLPSDFADQKAAVHFNLNSASANQRFKLQFLGNYVFDDNQLPTQDLTSYAILTEPNAPSIYNTDGTLNWAPNGSGTSTFVNPLAVQYTPYINKTRNLIGNLTLGYKILSDLEIRCSFGYNDLITEDFSPTPKISMRPERRASTNRTAVYGSRMINSWNIEPQLEYKKTIGNGKFDFLLGSTILENNSKGGYTFGSGYNSDNVLENMRAAASFGVGSYFENQYRYNALFGRLNYTWQEQIILNLTGRRDGSSRFGSDNQFHNFGAIGGAWIFSNKNFFKRNLSVLSFGKLRGSYGTTGNDQIADYSFLSLYGPITGENVPYQGVTGLQPSGLPNIHLQWEETRKLQVGIDVGLIHDRVLVQATYSRNRSSNQLISFVLPTITGFNGIIENFPATVQNVSWEFSLNSANVKNKEFAWTTNFNFTIPKNKLVEFPNLASSIFSNFLIVGQPIGILKEYTFLGVDPVSGLYQVDDGKGNPITTYPNNTTTTVNTFPKFYGGIQNNLAYKGFELDFFFHFIKQLGQNNFFDNGSVSPGQFNRGFSNQPTSVLNRWQKPGDVTTIQKYSTSLSAGLAKASDAYYSDASFIRLKNIMLSWQVPTQWGKTLKMQNCRVYVQGQNLLTFTKYKGLDPETRSISALPPLKVLTVGAQIGF